MSKVQFNLLPDVKLEYIKAQRTKRLVYLGSFVVAGAAVGLAIIMFITVGVVQKKQLRSADEKIAQSSKQLKNIDSLDKILTIQNQLTSLPSLHQKKHILSRIYDYLPLLTPPKLNMGKLNIEAESSTLTISGTADTLQTINTFVDTLKFTTFIAADANTDAKSDPNATQTDTVTTEEKNAFSTVTLDQFGKDEKGSTYKVIMQFDPMLFDITKTVSLKVPSQYTTRSVTEEPDSAIFNGQVGDDEAKSSDSSSGGTR